MGFWGVQHESTPDNAPLARPQIRHRIRREMTLAAENSDFPGFHPEPAYMWLRKNGAEQHLYKANAMPIYITVLDDSAGKSLFAFGPALVGGLRPADFSYEYFGEFMP